MGVKVPHLPYGTPPPLGIEYSPPKMRYSLFHKGANRVFMKTPLEKSLSLALTYSSGEQHSLSVARSAPPKLFSAGTPLGRGGRLDAHERRFYLISRLACEVAVFTPPKLFSAGTPSCRDFQARAQDARGESLALRRVVLSPKKRRRTHTRPLGVYVKSL